MPAAPTTAAGATPAAVVAADARATADEDVPLPPPSLEAFPAEDATLTRVENRLADASVNRAALVSFWLARPANVSRYRRLAFIPVSVGDASVTHEFLIDSWSAEYMQYRAARLIIEPTEPGAPHTLRYLALDMRTLLPHPAEDGAHAHDGESLAEFVARKKTTQA